jgi:hypothetical protein
MKPVSLLWLGLAAAGCAAPATGTFGYVLLDRDAREAGLQVEAAGWQRAPLLPLALKPEEAVSLVSGGGKVPLALRAGALAWVRGGLVEYHPLGDEARADRLIVDGGDRAVRTLADLLGADAGPRDDGRWIVSGPDLYGRASFMPAPDGITAVEPELSMIAPTTATAAAAPIAPSSDGLRTPALTALVGIYFSGDRMLVLDTGGGFTLGDACGRGEVTRGTFLREDGRVILAPAFADSTAFSLGIGDDGTLRDATGEQFAAAAEEVRK